MLTYREYENRAAWLGDRKNSIGASEIAAVMGLNSLQSPQQVYREKVGLASPPDLSNNAAVQYGTAAEQHLRELFALKHLGEYEVEYHPYRVYYDSDTPCLTCTLDGELIRCEDGKRGVWECKTALANTKASAQAWDGQVPQKYYCQLCQQLGITDYDFAILNAELRHPDGSAEIKEYYVEYNDIENDIGTVLEFGREFWRNNVLAKKEPPVILRL